MNSSSDPSQENPPNNAPNSSIAAPAIAAPATDPVAQDWGLEDRSQDQKTPPSKDQPPHAWTGDKGFFRLVIWFAGFSLVFCILGMIGLAAGSREVPDGLVASASGLVGLLTGVFVVKSNSN
jgi:hypothetical protein